MQLPSGPHFLWITQFPLFTRADEDKAFLTRGRWASSHHPFTAPMFEDLEDLKQGKVDTVSPQATLGTRRLTATSGQRSALRPGLEWAGDWRWIRQDSQCESTGICDAGYPAGSTIPLMADSEVDKDSARRGRDRPILSSSPSFEVRSTTSWRYCSRSVPFA